jgi:phospholipase/carboxylesterase
MNRFTFKEFKPKSGKSAEQLVIFLHGFGANGENLIELGQIMSTQLPDVHFVSPNAPFACEGTGNGYQWFDLWDRSEEMLYQGLESTAPLLTDFIDQQLKRLDLSYKNLALIGFSQGTMMSLHMALRKLPQIAALIGFSGGLIAGSNLPQTITAKPPTLLIHGDADTVVPVQKTEQALKAMLSLTCPAQAHILPGLGHSIDQAGLKLATEFLTSNLI